MTKSNEIRELSRSELDGASGGVGWFALMAGGIVGNLAYDLIKKESEGGFVGNAVKQLGDKV